MCNRARNRLEPETLFAEWYVARHQRRERLANIKRIAEEKQEARAPIVGGEGEAAHAD